MQSTKSKMAPFSLYIAFATSLSFAETPITLTISLDQTTHTKSTSPSIGKSLRKR